MKWNLASFLQSQSQPQARQFSDWDEAGTSYQEVGAVSPDACGSAPEQLCDPGQVITLSVLRYRYGGYTMPSPQVVSSENVGASAFSM